MLSLAGFLFIPSIYFEAGKIHYGPGYPVKLVCIFLLVHTVLTNAYMKKLFSRQVIIIVGGMCYSIYLLHLAIVSAVGTALLKMGVRLDNKWYFPFYFLLLIASVLLISAGYFLLIEKPFMRPVKQLRTPR